MLTERNSSPSFLVFLFKCEKALLRDVNLLNKLIFENSTVNWFLRSRSIVIHWFQTSFDNFHIWGVSLGDGLGWVIFSKIYL